MKQPVEFVTDEIIVHRGAFWVLCLNDRHACNFNFALTFNSLDLNIHQQIAQEAQNLNNFPNKFDNL